MANPSARFAFASVVNTKTSVDENPRSTMKTFAKNVSTVELLDRLRAD
ncbi:Conserved hypothetical protein [Prochlorococcus marinus str. MIT 9313]|uniref:Uncharacterized protein n=1 Tax=Prochlorococcus marinus (strain MIT 9313) TaxID=74547 RepID=B9ES42_PROMM|nr:Conserved hypothetical protein [Prochlorococcus marinus str. MIT 9313]